MTGTRPCPRCGTPNAEGSRFCGSCGLLLAADPRASLGYAPTVEHTLAGAPANAELADTTAPGMDTVPGMAAQAAAQAPAPQPAGAAGTPAPPRRPAPANATMLGMPMNVQALAAAQARAPSTAQAATPSGPGAAPPPQAGAPQPLAPAVPPAPQPGSVPANSNRTMLGMPMQQAALAALAQAQQQAAAAQGQGPGAGQGPAAPRMSNPGYDPTNRTMLGMSAAAQMAQAQVAANAGASPHGAPPGNPWLASPPTGPAAHVGPVDAPLGPPAILDDSLETRRPKRGGAGWLLIAIPLVLLLIAAVGVGGFLFLRSRRPTLRAAVVQTDSGDALQLDLPGAAPGTRVRFSGTERPVAAGRAVLPIPNGSLHVGDNELSVDVVSASGAVDSTTVHLMLAYRVHVDLGGLTADEPALEVVIDAPNKPGVTATVNDQPVTLTAGHGTMKIPLATLTAGADGYLSFRARYRVVTGGSDPAATGEVSARIPMTSLVVDRPGEQLVTDRSVVEVAGAVDPQATVRVGRQGPGEAAPTWQNATVHDGHFLERVPLSAMGVHTLLVTATAPGKAPKQSRSSVTRVADLAAQARQFGADPALTYARIAQNPNTYIGQRIRLEGRVYNVVVQGGHSDIQMLARDCPRGTRCPVWVSLPAATDATVDSWVEIVGTVAGEQQFRSETERFITVPRVNAAFVLPASGAR